MTLVAAFAGRDFAIIVADRRRTQVEAGVSVDDVRKIHQLNDNVAVGFSGIYEPIGGGMFQGVAEHIINATMPLISMTDTVESIAAVYRSEIDQLMESGMK